MFSHWKPSGNWNTLDLETVRRGEFFGTIEGHGDGTVFSGGAGGARAPLEFRGSQKGQSLISAYQSLAITTNTPGLEKLNTALLFN